MRTPVELTMVGAGLRGGQCYGPVALRHPDELRFVEVVEPNPARRRQFAEAHGIPEDRAHPDVATWLGGARRSQAAVIATPDRQHAGPAVEALIAGYDVLLEKPMAPTPEACVELVGTAKRLGRTLQVCHVLRYTAFFRRVHEIVSSGVLGELVTVEHRENVASWHMTHSYVRGAYAATSSASPLLLAKACHDLDVLAWTLDDPCVRVSSVGSLRHFRPDHAPAGAPARCTDGCPVEPQCEFSALHVYLGDEDGASPYGWRPRTPYSWMPLTDGSTFDPTTGMLTETATDRLAELARGPYGRCVYHCDNDAVDNQVVTMELASGTTAVLVVHGHSDTDERTMRYDGARATLRGRFGDFSPSELTLHHHRSGEVEHVPVDAVPGLHGGGDVGLMRDFAACLRGDTPPRSEAADALESHLLGFAAEAARRGATVVDVTRFCADLGWHHRT